MLYIISTPIGNLEDISLRALRILKDEVSLIAAEDTRTSMKLLSHYGIKKPLMSCFEHNETRRMEEIVQRVKAGENIAYVSDAGTPSISDPGFKLVRYAISQGIKVVPIPGPAAIITCLSVSGLPTDRFAFEGFLPPKPGSRKNRLISLAQEERTLIFYESPHRIMKTLQDMLEVFGDRQIAVGKELTKIYEEVFRGKISEVITHLVPEKVRGEFTIVTAGHTKNE
ncbi:MAG: 16S rRNA (cytidine(1402)-2'-O)-methyltransferase [Planctomycetes bacterium]|nr:16S rRNA (cytidine(1402)-2'-O)-methyltransferase [Planctomycetota bacterium]